MKASTIGFAAALAVTLGAPAAHAAKVYLNGVEVTGITNQTFEGATVSIDAQGDVHIQAEGYRVQVIEPGATSTTTSTSAATTGAASTAATPVYSDSGQAMYAGPSSFNRPLVATATTTTTTTSSVPANTATTTTASAVPTAPPATGTTSPLTKRYFLITQGTGGSAVGETVRVDVNGTRLREVDSGASQVIDDITDQIRLGSNSVTMTSAKKPTYVPSAASSTFQVIIGEGHVEAGGRVVIDLPVVTYTRTAADSTGSARTFTLDGR